MFMWFDPVYLIFMLPGLVLAGFATWYTRSTFARYSRVASGSGMTGAQAAAAMLADQGVRDVAIEPVRGFLSDHYDPTSKTLRLSPDVYASRSLSAIGVACHEAGHALQHATNYAALGLRSALVPATQFGSSASYIFILLGLFLHPFLGKIGIILLGTVVLFSLVTLPVEWNASARAKRLMVASGIVSSREGAAAGQVLNAAFLTYIASAVTALLTLLYWVMRFGLLGGRDD